MVVALLLCTSAVTPIPAQKASGFFDAPAKDSTQTRAEDAHYAGSNMSPQTSRATAESRLSSVNTSSGSPYRYMFLKQLNDQRTGNTLTGIFTVPFDIRFSG